MQSFAPDSVESYKRLARTWAATVNVVTVRHSLSAEPDAPDVDGFTATAFFTVSIAPPIICISATTKATAFTMLRDCAAFAVNLLGVDQVDVATRFAKPSHERAGVFDRVKWTKDEYGVPLLDGTTGAFSAKVRQLVDAGDHTLVLGDVTAIHLGGATESLVYHERGYGRVVMRE